MRADILMRLPWNLMSLPGEVIPAKENKAGYMDSCQIAKGFESQTKNVLLCNLSKLSCRQWKANKSYWIQNALAKVMFGEVTSKSKRKFSMAQWLGLHAFTVKGPGSIPDQGTRIPQHGEKKDWGIRGKIFQQRVELGKVNMRGISKAPSTGLSN